MGLRLLSAVAILAFAASLGAQDQRQAPPRRALPQVTQDFVSVDAPVVVLQHVCVIDGTGSAPADDQTVVIENGLIRSIGAGGSVPAGAKSDGPHGLHRDSRARGDARAHVLSRRARRAATRGNAGDVSGNGLQLSAALSRGGRHDDPHRRKYGAVFGFGDQELHRSRPHPWTKNASDRSLSSGAGILFAAAAHADGSRRRDTLGELLGGRRIHII